MAVKLKCPDCHGKFPYIVSDGWPRFCPLCGSDINNDRADDDIVMPFIRSSVTRNNDALYRQMEEGSAVRAEEAARLAGTSVEEMSGLKITNLNSTKHAGDIAAPEPVAAMANLGVSSAASLFKGSNGAEFSQSVQVPVMPSGKDANMGAKMRTAMQGYHAERTGGTGVFDRPALETTQPGYRRRG